MRCPFLKRTQVKYCSLYHSKLIPMPGNQMTDERCSGPGWTECSLASAQTGHDASAGRCPYLREECAQYCYLSPVKKLVLCRDGERSRCMDDCHQYCPVYLEHAHSGTEGALFFGSSDEEQKAREQAADPSTNVAMVDQIPVRTDLQYCRNHLWFSLSDNGICHIGGDAFMATVFAAATKVRFGDRTRQRKAIVRLRAFDLDFDIQFPRDLQPTECNSALERDARMWLSDPYGQGWFMQCCLPDGENQPCRQWFDGLLSGDQAVDWMGCESRRLKRIVHDQGLEMNGLGTLMHDGGELSPQFARSLNPSNMIQLYAEFFCLVQ